MELVNVLQFNLPARINLPRLERAPYTVLAWKDIWIHIYAHTQYTQENLAEMLTDGLGAGAAVELF